MKNFTLVHSTNSWLPLTENWIYEQIKILPFNQIVLSDRKATTFPEEVKCKIKSDFLKNKFNYLSNYINSQLFTTDLFRKSELKKIQKPYILFSHYGTRGFNDLGLKPYKHIIRFYGFDLKRIIYLDPEWKNRYKKLFKEGHAFITEGPFMKQQLIEIGCPENKVYVVAIGTNIEVDFKIRSFKDESTLNILIASSFTETKGITYALEAIGRLKLNNLLDDFLIHLVGDVPDHYLPNIKCKETILNLIKKYKLQEHIHHYGYIQKNELKKLALICHIGIHPSVWSHDHNSEGGYPIVIPDLMATGLPFITTDHCDIPEIVNNSNGYICKERSVEAIKHAIMDIITNKSGLEKKSFEARKTIVDKYDWKILGKKLSETILNIVQN